MRALILCMINDQNVGERIADLFSAMDFLTETGGSSVEERRIHNQEYRRLSGQLAFEKNLTRYDIQMAQRTSRFPVCPIGVAA